MTMTTEETADFCVRILHRASKDAWICGDNAEAKRLSALAYQTRMEFNAKIKVGT